MQRLVFGLGGAVLAVAIAGYLLFSNGADEAIVADQQATPQPAASQDVDATTPAGQANTEGAGSPAASGDSEEQDQRPQVVLRSGTDAAGTPDGATPESRPTFDVVRVEPSGETVIAGRAEPDSEVKVTLGKGGTVGTAKADSSGAWAIVAEQPLAPGSHQIGIEAKTPDGQKQLSENLVVVMVPESKVPAATPPAGQNGGAAQPEEAPVLAVLTPRAGGASKVLPQEPEEGISEGSLALDSVDYDEGGRAVLGGRATPGARMLVYLNNRPIGEAVAGDDGRWRLSPASPILEGLHDLRVDQVDGGGGVVARVETPFSRETPRSVAESVSEGEDYVIVQPGNSLWRIARRSYGQGLQYTVIYQANAQQIGDPDLIYPGQVFTVPKLN
ncbi:LysM peptidoglycan-binding domain-containing protein [Pelagibius litoralis]|uniref:LysM peptidoglycan-binding domain-containing protein n=1 Tax=Pelagibius litoralis TaxID=374515 RepID=A0A967F0R3_9PROT|nr:Ig-like domain-containing protein [Pelagibius litoralis]NIA70894.1 LysM peptidoglycan-binding domain-containing protein [Pelagibius litoralis]